MDNPIIIKLLFIYMPINEIANMRRFSKQHRDIIDRFWKDIVRNMIQSIGYAPNGSLVDINDAVRRVYRNEELLIKVLEQQKLQTGFTLTHDGMELLGMLDVEEIDSKAKILLPYLPEYVNNKDTEGPAAKKLYSSAISGDLALFKQEYYLNKSKGQNPGWNLVFKNYLAGLIKKSVNNYSINWSIIEQWDKTDFYKFIKPSLRAYFISDVISMFTMTSQETRIREHNNIVDFIRRTMTPYIEQEKVLLSNVIAHNVEVLPPIYGRAHKTTHALALAVTGFSLIRNLYVKAASIDANLAIEYFTIAHELFDLKNDPMLQQLSGKILQGQTYELIEHVTKYYTIPMNIHTFFLVGTNKLPVDSITDPRTKLKIIIMCGNDIEEISKKMNEPSALRDLAEEPTADLEHHTMFNLNELSSCSSGILWMPVEKCMKIFEALPAGHRSYELFITKDLSFWKIYIYNVFGISDKMPMSENFKDDQERMYRFIQLLNFHIVLNSVDVVRYIYTILDGTLFKTHFMRQLPPSKTFDTLLNEVYKTRNLTIDDEQMWEMPRDDMRFDVNEQWQPVRLRN